MILCKLSRWQWLYGILIAIDYPVAVCGIVILLVFARVGKEKKEKFSKHTFKILICAVLQSAFKASANLTHLNQAIKHIRNDADRDEIDAHTVVDFFGLMFK